MEGEASNSLFISCVSWRIFDTRSLEKFKAGYLRDLQTGGPSCFTIVELETPLLVLGYLSIVCYIEFVADAKLL